MRSTLPNNFRAGFTLVELLIVMSILGICGAMTVASIGNGDGLLVSAAARSVMADLNYAQTRAISLRKKVFVQQTGQQYVLLSRDSNFASPATITNPVTHAPYVATFRGDGPTSQVSLTNWNFGTASIIGFDELGSPFSYDAAHNLTTSLTSAGSFSLVSGAAQVVITIQPFTGDLSAE